VLQSLLSFSFCFWLNNKEKERKERKEGKEGKNLATTRPELIKRLLIINDVCKIEARASLPIDSSPSPSPSSFFSEVSRRLRLHLIPRKCEGEIRKRNHH
jgi:hypothetical protein